MAFRRLAQIEFENGYLDQIRPQRGQERSPASQRSTLVGLLEAIANVFSAEGDAENQIRSYRLLIQLEPLSDRFRVGYIGALAKHSLFIERELRAHAFDRTDWLATARRLDYYFNVLVDKGLFEARVAEQIRRSGQSAENFSTSLERLQHAIPQARSHFASGRDGECQAVLNPVLDSVPNDWVVISHLEALDLWLRSAARLNRNGDPAQPGIDLYNRRAALMRDGSLRYITQFGLTIDDPIIQQLAVQLVETLRDAVPEKQAIAGLLPAAAA